MENQAEVREFLATRRARITPEQAGIIGGGRRRVAGLRREEVAMLAGMSIDYYARMERGNLAGVSTGSSTHSPERCSSTTPRCPLHDLARAATPVSPARRRRPVDTTIRPSLQRLLDAITGAPAWISNPRKDFLATNALGAALFAPILDDPANGRNNARFTFLSPSSRIFYPEWEQGANSIVASLRLSAGQNPHDTSLTNLIGELVTRSDAFRMRWAAHDVRLHHSGTKHIHHPAVGDLEFIYEGLELPSNPGLVLFACTAEPGSPTEERLRLLGSLAATEGSTISREQPRG